MEFIHQTVMLQEALDALDPKEGGLYVDCTSGGGGHTRAILERIGPTGRVIGLDRDPAAIEHLEEALGAHPNLVLVNANYSAVDEVLSSLDLEQVDGMLLDLGLSSYQLEGSGRGFSFDRDEPLDMRMDRDSGLSARELVNRLPEARLADLIYKYGEERASRRIARAICRVRRKKPIETSLELAEIVRRALWRPGRRPRLDPATRTFMALRLAVNQELGHLTEFLAKAPGLLTIGGRLVVISFHSLEDRLVKQSMVKRKKAESGEPGLLALYKKPLTASPEEVAGNPRSRSAKLRAGERF